MYSEHDPNHPNYKHLPSDRLVDYANVVLQILSLEPLLTDWLLIHTHPSFPLPPPPLNVGKYSLICLRRAGGCIRADSDSLMWDRLAFSSLEGGDQKTLWKRDCTLKKAKKRGGYTAVYLCVIKADNEMTRHCGSWAEAFKEHCYLTCCSTLIWA